MFRKLVTTLAVATFALGMVHAEDKEKAAAKNRLNDKAAKIQAANSLLTNTLESESKKEEPNWVAVEAAVQNSAQALEGLKDSENDLKKLSRKETIMWISAAGGAVVAVGGLGMAMLGGIVEGIGGALGLGHSSTPSMVAIGSVGVGVVALGLVGTNLFYVMPKKKRLRAAVKESVAQATLMYANFCRVSDLVIKKNTDTKLLTTYPFITDLCASVRGVQKIQGEVDEYAATHPELAKE